MSKQTVRWGEKRPRVVMPLAGALLLLMGAAGVYANFDRSRWMRSYPYPAVLMFAKGGDRDALRELHRRYKNVELSDSATRSLIEEALDVQRTDPAPPNLADWLALLDNFDTGRSFTASQRERYVEQVFHNVKLEPRTVYREGERLMASLELELRYAGSPCTAHVARHFAKGNLVTTKYDKSNRFAPIPSLRQSGQQTLKFPAIAPGSGTGTVEYEVMLRISAAGADSIQRTISLTAPIQVEPFGATAVIVDSENTSLAKRLSRAISIDLGYSAYQTSDTSRMEHQLDMEFQVSEPFAASLVADVIVRHLDTEFQGGTLTAWKGTKVLDVNIDFRKLSQLSSGELTLVLKHNPSVVHQTAGLDEVYVGDLMLEPILVLWPPGWDPEDR